LFRTEVLQWHFPRDPMVGNFKPHRTKAPPIGHLLCSLKSLEQSYHKHNLAGAQGAVLDLWEASLYVAP
jgi:hypothetical protein